MKTTTEHAEDTENAAPAPWHSRWYSAAKRGGLTVIASCLVSEALTILSAFFRGSPGMFVRLDWLFLLAPVVAAAWGFLAPRKYAQKPPLRVRVEVFALAVFLITAFIGLLTAAWFFFHSSEKEFRGEAFTPEVWSFCNDRLHLAPDADLRPAGFLLGGFQDKFVQAKFLTGEPDPARLFDTNAVDLSDVRPGGYAANIDLPSDNGRGRSSGPRWWTPAGEHAVSGRARFRDEDADRRECMYIAVDALPDGDHALYIFWFES